MPIKQFLLIGLLICSVTVGLVWAWPTRVRADSLISGFANLAAQPKATFVPNGVGSSGSFNLSYDHGEQALAWVLGVYPGDDFDIERGHSVRQLYYVAEQGAPPASVAWDGLDSQNQPLPAGNSYLVYFEVTYPDAILSYSGAFIPSRSYTTAELGVPTITTNAATVGKGAIFTIDNSAVADGQLLALFWRLTVMSDDSKYIFSTMLMGDGTSRPVADLPTTFEWSGYDNVGQVFPAGRYRVGVEMLIVTALGPQYTHATMWLPVVEAGQNITEPVSSIPTPTPTPDPATKLHPVLLIHGLTAYPDSWMDAANNNDYPALLQSWGYPADYVSMYHYTGIGVGKDGYNNQGDIPEMAAGMHDAVEKLHQISLAHGGDGKVDIICHSMGGLITRQYLKDHPNDDYLSKVISVGTPYQGSWLMGLDDYLGVFRPATNFGLRSILEQIGFNADPNQKSEREMIPGSSILQQLDLISYQPSVEYYTIYGYIDTTVTFKLFDMTLFKRGLDVGDGVVSSKSASTVSSTQFSNSFKFEDSSEHEINFALNPDMISYQAITAGSSIFNSKYFHINLTKQEDVQEKIEDILQQ